MRWRVQGPLKTTPASSVAEEDIEPPIDMAQLLARAVLGVPPGLAPRTSSCCDPLPGEKIIGINFADRNKGVVIHRVDCVALSHFGQAPERWLELAWDDEWIENFAANSKSGAMSERFLAQAFSVRDSALCFATFRTLWGAWCSLIGREKINITYLNFTNCAHDYFDIRCEVEIKHVSQIENLLKSLHLSSHCC